MPKWIQTKFEGVRYREHPTRKSGKDKKAVRKDRYYAIRYYHVETDENGVKVRKRMEETLGWETHWKQSHPDGTTSLEQEAVRRRAQLMKNKAEKKGPQTLKEDRAENDAERQAEAAERKKRADAAKTLKDYWDETYFPLLKRSKKKESSWEKEESHFRLWIAPVMGSIPLKDIGLNQWDELIKLLVDSGKSQRTRLYVTGTLRLILKHAFKRKLIADIPPSGKDVGITNPGNNRRTRTISYYEQELIMKELDCRDRHAWRITRFAFLTGCRASEASNLVWANVNLSQGQIVFPKTKNDDFKTIAITPRLKELFESMDETKPDKHVFPMKNGSPYKEPPSVFKTVVDAFELNKGRSKLDRLSFHSIRHTVATILGEQLGLRDLMDTIGWKTAQMAMRYVHENKDRKVRALATLGEAPQTGKVLQFQAKA